MSTQFDQVSIVKQANIYFDGKCVSHTVMFPDGTKKTLGVIFPSSLTFNTGAAEIMELNAGKCRIRLCGDEDLPRGKHRNAPVHVLQDDLGDRFQS